MTAATWIRSYQENLDYIESLSGIMWNDAPLPPRWHRCGAQTRGWISLNYIERCPCGATRLAPGGRWTERNQTRKSQARRRREDRLPRVQVTCLNCGNPYEAAAGTRQARQQQCTACWADLFVTSNGEQH
jgi:hypothetical protein